MNGIDTNVLVRFLVQDDKNQSKRVNRLFEQAEQNKDRLFVSAVVLLETLWVLESAYGVDRKSLVEIFQDLLLLPVLDFEKQTVIRRCLVDAASNNFDLTDLLIGHIAESAGCGSIYTFDKKATRHPLFESL